MVAIPSHHGIVTMQEIEFPIPLTDHEKALITAIAAAEGYDNPEDYMRLVIEGAGVADGSGCSGSSRLDH